MDLMFFIHGRKEDIIRNNGLVESELKIVKIDDKDLANRKLILSTIKSYNFNKVYFATKRLRYQRFLLIMKSYLFIARKGGAIIDKDGNRDTFSALEHLLIGIPTLTIESIASAFTYLWHFTKVYQIKRAGV